MFNMQNMQTSLKTRNFMSFTSISLHAINIFGASAVYMSAQIKFGLHKV